MAEIPIPWKESYYEIIGNDGVNPDENTSYFLFFFDSSVALNKTLNKEFILKFKEQRKTKQPNNVLRQKTVYQQDGVYARKF